MAKLIAVVDDEPDIVELVSLHLKRAGFTPKGFPSAESFFEFIDRRSPDLVILDLMLPGADGFEICKYLQTQEKFSSIPIIMLTAKTDETDRVLGLELGADDYVTKPFSPKELVARVKAVLRRGTKEETGRRTYVDGILLIDLEKYEATVEGKRVPLTSTEFRILALLSSRKGRVFTRNEILEYLWEDEKFVLDKTVDVHIKNLREKLGKVSKFIRSVRGVGYKLEE